MEAACDPSPAVSTGSGDSGSGYPAAVSGGDPSVEDRRPVPGAFELVEAGGAGNQQDAVPESARGFTLRRGRDNRAEEADGIAIRAHRDHGGPDVHPDMADAVRVA